MKVLVVDDDYAKTKEIYAALELTEIVDLDVQQVTTAHAARLMLQNNYFDMLIIDLHLPAVMGGKPDNKGGLNLFDIICLDRKVHLPPDILFITCREELIGEANSEVIKRGGVLCQYRSDSDEWKNVLIGRVKYVYNRFSRCKQVDLVIVTALKMPELNAVLDLPYNWRQKRFEGDPLTYHFGSISRADKNVSVVSVSPRV